MFRVEDREVGLKLTVTLDIGQQIRQQLSYRCLVIHRERICCKQGIGMQGCIYEGQKGQRLRIIVIVRNKNNNSPMLKTLPLADMFKDQSYAWQLLESEILIETVQQPEGQDISNLLQLYMRGVEVMNTCLDPRQSYFRSKVTALMAKNTVRKTFKAKQEEAPKVAEVKQEKPKEEPKRTPKKEMSKKSEGFVSATALQEKKKELELRLAYATEEHNPEGLRKIIAQNKQAEIQLVSKVQKLMQSHEERLNQRINRRKLKTATYRSRAQDQSESLQALDQHSANNTDVVAVPISNQSAPLNLIPEVIAEHAPQEGRRMHKSADAKAQIRENSEPKQEPKEAISRDRRLSLHLQMLRVC